MEIYGFIEVGSVETIGESARGYRNVVMDYNNDCVSRFDNVLKVESSHQKNSTWKATTTLGGNP